jgi:plastocyanin
LFIRHIIASVLLTAMLGAAEFRGSVELADSRQPSVVKNKDYSGVVVWLEPVGAPVPAAPATFTMLQKGKRFQPHVLAIPVGSTVDFPNVDPIFHNAFSNFAGQPFDTGLYRPGTSRKIQFRRDGVVRVFCNIHSSMSAVIVVLRTSYFAVSAQDGRFALNNVPPGDYRLQVWHERAASAVLEKLGRTVHVDAAGADVPVLRISESGFVQVPHKNKFGAEYGPEPSDKVYPGGHK